MRIAGLREADREAAQHSGQLQRPPAPLLPPRLHVRRGQRQAAVPAAAPEPGRGGRQVPKGEKFRQLTIGAMEDAPVDLSEAFIASNLSTYHTWHTPLGRNAPRRSVVMQ